MWPQIWQELINQQLRLIERKCVNDVMWTNSLNWLGSAYWPTSRVTCGKTSFPQPYESQMKTVLTKKKNSKFHTALTLYNIFLSLH